jgi:hypothetical protein
MSWPSLVTDRTGGQIGGHAIDRVTHRRAQRREQKQSGGGDE